MKCKFCDGSGKDYWYCNGVPYPCPVCNGTGEIKDKPLTNDEWRRTCSTEEFAKWIYDIRFDFQIPWKNKEIAQWLKEKHE